MATNIARSELGWRPVTSSKKAAKTLGGVSTSAGGAFAAVALLRSMFGDSLPWTPEQDAWVAGVFATLGAAAWRFVADWLKHRKDGDQ